jgi:hypothetical protein
MWGKRERRRRGGEGSKVYMSVIDWIGLYVCSVFGGVIRYLDTGEQNTGLLQKLCKSS